MAYGRRDFAGGAVTTTLVGSITALDTSWSLADTTGWPQGTNGPFYAVFNRKGSSSNPQGTAAEEKVLVQTLVGTTVTLADASFRGVDGTTSQAWAAPTSFEHCGTAVDFDEANLTVSQTLGQVQGKGDLLVGKSANRLVRLAPSSDGLFLLYDSTQQSGLVGGGIPAGAISDVGMFGTEVVPNTALQPDSITPDRLIPTLKVLRAVGTATYTVNVESTFTGFGTSGWTLTVDVPTWAAGAVIQTSIEGVWVADGSAAAGFQFRVEFDGLDGAPSGVFSDQPVSCRRYIGWTTVFTGITVGTAKNISIQGARVAGDTGSNLHADTSSYLTHNIQFTA